MLLIFVSIAIWVNLIIGLVLVAFMGIMRIQQSKTDWCFPDPFLRRMGMKKKLETVESK
jgi:hypothetical protein